MGARQRGGLCQSWPGFARSASHHTRATRPDAHAQACTPRPGLQRPKLPLWWPTAGDVPRTTASESQTHSQRGGVPPTPLDTRAPSASRRPFGLDRVSPVPCAADKRRRECGRETTPASPAAR